MTTSTLSTTDQAALADIAQVLAKHNMLDKFGVYLQHEHFAIESDESIHEVNDQLGRISIRRPIKNSDLPDRAFDTAWALTADGQTRVTAWCCD